MPVGGHHAVAFVAKIMCPEAPLWLFMKYTMMSDTLAVFLVWCGVEGLTVDYAFLSQPLQSTSEKIKEWKADGRWLRGVDPERGVNGFEGFHGVGPGYYDITFSHSYAVILLAAMVCGALHVAVNRQASTRSVLWVVVCVSSHVVFDSMVHDTYILWGNRALTRVSLGVWRSDLGSMIMFVVEMMVPLLAFFKWKRETVLVDDTDSGTRDFNLWARRYFAFVWLWSNPSWYGLPILAQWLWPVFHLGQNSRVAALGILSWTLACYPCARMEALRATRTSLGGDDLTIHAKAGAVAPPRHAAGSGPGTGYARLGDSGV
mmetsp:Transcript_5860/g.17424  ORF Transcript_5860/g.17424 Transcript_5860/m.17424 type:complete len:317 (-) Transcript_5860:164-1114(-)